MAAFPPSFDYTDRDQDSIRERLINLLQSVFPDWTEYDVALFGTMLIESFSFVGDIVTHYQNRQAREAFWGLAQLRKSLLNLGKAIGFQPSTATASQVDVTISLASGLALADIAIPAGTVVSTRSVSAPTAFEMISDQVIPSGASEVSGATAENSEVREETFESDGLPNQETILTSIPFLDGSLVVADGIGIFVVVDSFLNSTPSDRHVTVTVDERDRATVRFGNGSAGAVPTGTVTLTYKIGGGVAGIVDAGTVTRLEGSFVDDLGNPVQLLVTNPSPSTPAVDRPTVEQIRISGPESTRVLTRTVGKDDYEINARRVPEVIRSLMLTSDQDPAVQENRGDLFIVVAGGVASTQATKDAVLVEVEDVRPNTITFQTSVKDPPFLPVNVDAIVFLRSGFDTAAARASALATILADLAAFFAIQNPDGTPNERIDFGFNYKDASGDPDPVLAWSDVHNVVRDSDPVRKVDAAVDGFLLNAARADVDLELREFPILGTVTIVDGSTGTPL